MKSLRITCSSKYGCGLKLHEDEHTYKKRKTLHEIHNEMAR